MMKVESWVLKTVGEKKVKKNENENGKKIEQVLKKKLFEKKLKYFEREEWSFTGSSA